jgi:hypothetical protein
MVRVVVAAPDEGADVESPIIVSNRKTVESLKRRCAALCHQTMLAAAYANHLL